MSTPHLQKPATARGTATAHEDDKLVFRARSASTGSISSTGVASLDRSEEHVLEVSAEALLLAPQPPPTRPKPQRKVCICMASIVAIYILGNINFEKNIPNHFLWCLYTYWSVIKWCNKVVVTPEFKKIENVLSMSVALYFQKIHYTTNQ